MYNTELKERFIQDFSASIASRQRALVFFNAIERYEAEMNADIVTMKETDALWVLESSTLGFRSTSLAQPLMVFRKYCEWCLSHDVPGVTDALLKISPKYPAVEKMASHTVKNPTHLQRVMDEVFDPVSSNGLDNLLRAYLWLAYSGVQEDAAELMTAENVDLENGCLRVDGKEYPLYIEAYPVFVFCKKSKFITRLRNHGNQHDPGHTEMEIVQRGDGELLLRNTSSSVTIQGLRSRTAIRTRAAKSEGFTKSSALTYGRLLLSGIYYRAHEREIAGLDMGFGEVVRQRKETSGATRKDYESDNRHLLKKDYETWKLTLI